MKRLILIAGLSLSLSSTIASAQVVPSYSLVKEIPIGGVGGGDYLSIDAPAHRLYVSHSTRVIVIDTLQDVVVGEIGDTPGVHGFAIAADLGRGFSTNGRENTISIVDLRTLRTLQKVATGTTPDAVLYDPSTHEVYSMNGRGQSATVIDGRTGTVVATIPLGGKPESAAVDVRAHRVFINIEDKNTIAVVDTATHKVVSEWPIAPGEEATGLAFDPEARRLFVGCRNKMMLMVDATNGKVLGSVPAGEGVDATWFDPSTSLVFSSAKEGMVTIARAEPSRLTAVATVKTFPGARTMALDTTTHRIYLSTATYRPLPAGAVGINGADPKPEPVAGTFRVLVFAPQGK